MEVKKKRRASGELAGFELTLHLVGLFTAARSKDYVGI